MKTKAVLIATLFAVCCGGAFAQRRSSLWLNERGPLRADVEKELKDILSEPEEDFSVLTERAMRDDPQALYALSQVCMAKGIAHGGEYLKRSAGLGYVKAQLRMAIGCLYQYSGLEELQAAKISCTNAIAAGYLCVTNLVPIIDNAIKTREDSDQAEKSRKEEQERMERGLRLAEMRQNGKNRPFKPFVEDEKMAFDEALARAETNDAVACYWLAYYFARGECVVRDGKSALKFLRKAVDADNPAACYTFGLLLENDALQDENGRSLGDRETRSGFYDLFFSFNPFGVAAWDTPGLEDGNRCLTNSVAVAHVESLYQKAFDGGFYYATNDIARLRRKVAECERRIVQMELDQKTRTANAEKAKLLIRDQEEIQSADGSKRGHDERRRQEEERKQERDEREHQRECWATWPRDLSNEEYGNLLCDAEEKYDSVILGLEYLVNSTRASSTNTWNIGCGRNLIKADECFVRKIDKEGRVVWLGGSERANDVEEIRWYNEERSRLLEAKRVKWAEEHGMTVEEASRKYDEWLRSPRSLLGLSRRPTTQLLPSGSKTLLGTGGSLRERRAARDQARQEELAKEKELEAKRKAEAAEKEKEREAQRQAEREEARRELKLLKDELEAQRKAAERARAERERGNN